MFWHPSMRKHRVLRGLVTQNVRQYGEKAMHCTLFFRQYCQICMFLIEHCCFTQCFDTQVCGNSVFCEAWFPQMFDSMVKLQCQITEIARRLAKNDRFCIKLRDFPSFCYSGGLGPETRFSPNWKAFKKWRFQVKIWASNAFLVPRVTRGTFCRFLVYFDQATQRQPRGNPGALPKIGRSSWT